MFKSQLLWHANKEKCQQEKEDDPEELSSVVAVEATTRLVEIMKHLMDRIYQLKGAAQETVVNKKTFTEKTPYENQRKGAAGCAMNWEISLGNPVNTNPSFSGKLNTLGAWNRVSEGDSKMA